MGWITPTPKKSIWHPLPYETALSRDQVTSKGWRNRRVVQWTKESEQKDEVVHRRRCGQTAHLQSLKGTKVGREGGEETRDDTAKGNQTRRKKDGSLQGKWVRRWVFKKPTERLTRDFLGPIQRRRYLKKVRAPSPVRGIGRTCALD